QPIRDFVGGGRPVLGTCAGLILLDRDHLGLMDIEARRNAFGRQLRSFEADVAVRGLGDEPLRAVFIRAPWIEVAGPGVEVLAEVGGEGVVGRERAMRTCSPCSSGPPGSRLRDPASKCWRRWTGMASSHAIGACSSPRFT